MHIYVFHMSEKNWTIVKNTNSVDIQSFTFLPS